MVCLYHLDDDGKCAAALVDRYTPGEDKKFIEMNYGYEVPFSQIGNNEVVFIVDFSIEPDDMLKLLEITKQVVWIDHHVTAIAKYAEFPVDIEGIRRTEHSGCMLTWMYFNNMEELAELSGEEISWRDDIPWFVRVCDDYDMWRFNLNITKDFHEGFTLIPHEPQDEIWRILDQNRISIIANTGKSLRQYRANMMADLIESYGFESTLEGEKCFVLNQGLISSEDFNSLDPGKYNFLVGIIYDGERWSYSLRSTPEGPNVANIAKKYGGGGHNHAAGFSCETLLIKKEIR